MKLGFTSIASAILATCVASGVSAAVMLTDSTVFSANETGHNWQGLIWNTQGSPDNRWNMYYSTSSDPLNPVFVNPGDGADISLELSAGTYDFVVFGEYAPYTESTIAPHFVLNLYFDGHTDLPDISGLYGETCLTVCAAGSSNGLDRFGVAGQQEAGTLTYQSGSTIVQLTQFEWYYNENVDQVWPYYAGDWQGKYSGTPDYVGRIQLVVSEVPLPATSLLLVAGLAGFGALRRRR